MFRKCMNCWWLEKGSCTFSIELRTLQNNYLEEDQICWAWRPQEVQEKFNYFERYGREVDRIGVLPVV